MTILFHKSRLREWRPFSITVVLVRMTVEEGEDGYMALARLLAEMTTTKQIMSWRNKIYRWKDRGLTITEADVLAILLHRHPSEVFTDWWEVIGQENDMLEESSSSHEDRGPTIYRGGDRPPLSSPVIVRGA